MPGICAPAKYINKGRIEKKEKEKKVQNSYCIFLFVNLIESCFEKHRHESFHKTTKKNDKEIRCRKTFRFCISH